MSNLQRNLGKLVLTALSLLLVSVQGYAAQATLAWDPNQEIDIEGYGVYFKAGTDGPPYELAGYVTKTELSDPNSPSFTVTGLQQDATYYFTVTAFDTSDNESAYSSSVCAQVGAVVTPCSAESDTGSGSTPAPSSGSASGGGGGGGGCFIQSMVPLKSRE